MMRIITKTIKEIMMAIKIDDKRLASVAAFLLLWG